MFSRIEILSERKLVGARMQMSFANNKTFELWNKFIPLLKKASVSKIPHLYSIEIYNNENFFVNFDPTILFDKWAAVEANAFEDHTDELESITLPEGLYAVFIHKGIAAEGYKTYEYIFNEWFPNSTYKLDNRPHVALMGEKYRSNDPNSEEEIWIPIRD